MNVNETSRQWFNGIITLNSHVKHTDGKICSQRYQTGYKIAMYHCTLVSQRWTSENNIKTEVDKR